MEEILAVEEVGPWEREVGGLVDGSGISIILTNMLASVFG